MHTLCMRACSMEDGQGAAHMTTRGSPAAARYENVGRPERGLCGWLGKQCAYGVGGGTSVAHTMMAACSFTRTKFGALTGPARGSGSGSGRQRPPPPSPHPHPTRSFPCTPSLYSRSRAAHRIQQHWTAGLLRRWERLRYLINTTARRRCCRVQTWEVVLCRIEVRNRPASKTLERGCGIVFVSSYIKVAARHHALALVMMMSKPGQRARAVMIRDKPV